MLGIAATLLLLLVQESSHPGVPAGWTIERVAQAPDVRHPSVLCCAPDGRLFVAEDPMDINAPADQPLGRIVCIFPDGRRTVFAEKLYAVFGMQYLEGKLYVLHNPKYTRFTDDNGVGRDRTDLIECTNPKPWALDWNDHVPSNFKLAMDGYFYVSVGDKGVFGAVGRDGRAVQLRGGGILRMRPDATNLEVLCTGTRNTLDVAINAEDEIFTYDNTDEHHWMGRLTHMVDGGFYGYPWDFHPRRPYTLWMMADYGGGAATGTLAYEEDALPAEFRGNLFLADFGKRTVSRVRVARQGATYAAVSREDFFVNGGARDNFRPVGICFSPDGRSIFIADWNHEGAKSKAVVGRVFKATYTGPSEAAPRPAWVLPSALGRKCDASNDELLAALSHPAWSVRMTAQRRLIERGEMVAIPLELLIEKSDAPAAARRHAIWALDGINGCASAKKGLSAAARSGDLSVRIQAVRQGSVDDPLLLELLRDPEPAMRFHSATALGRRGRASAVPALQAALEEKDLFARHAAFTALHRIGRKDPAAWPAIARGLQSGVAAVREGTLFAMRDVAEPAVLDALCRTTGDVRPAALEFLARIARKDPEWKGEWWPSPYHPALAPRPRRTVEWEGTAAALDALQGALDDADPRVRRAGVEGIVELREAPLIPRLRERLAKEPDPEAKGTLLRALGVLKDKGAMDAIAAALVDEANPVALRLLALAAAEEIGGSEVIAKFLASRPANRELFFRAIAAASKTGKETAAESLLPLLQDSDAEVRKASIAALGQLKIRKSIPGLAAAFGDEKTRFEAADALSRMPDLRGLDAYVYGLASANPGLRERCAKAVESLGRKALRDLESRIDFSALPPQTLAELQRIFATEPDSSPLFKVKPKKVDPSEYLDFAVKTAGDPARGRPLFHDLQGLACIKCHRVDGAGGEIGPDLSHIGSQYSRAELAESVVFPSRKIREGYQQVKVMTRSGRIVAGAVKGETAEELILQDAEGTKHALAKSEIDKRASSDLSLMPDGLHGGLTMKDFADLISYLESLKAPKK
jgi:putative membrane-bound dehydrogenase-like protein